MYVWSGVSSYSEPLIGYTFQQILYGRIAGDVVVAASREHREAAIKERGRVWLQAQDTSSAPPDTRQLAEPEEALCVGLHASPRVEQIDQQSIPFTAVEMLVEQARGPHWVTAHTQAETWGRLLRFCSLPPWSPLNSIDRQ